MNLRSKNQKESLMFKRILSLCPRWTFSYASFRDRCYSIVASPYFSFILSLLLFFLSPKLYFEAECYSYNPNLIVVDRIQDEEEFFYDSWLVHMDHALEHLELSESTITLSIVNGSLMYSPTQGEIYISTYNINPIEWSRLIIGHPEIVHSGYTCIIDYDNFDEPLPRDAVITVQEFLYSYCR